MKKLTTKEKHGMSKHPIYRVWADMKNRCYNENIEAYDLYGGRGIEVCDEWFYSFSKFLEDMGEGYKRGLRIDKIDNDKNYCKENCRWVSTKISAVNKRQIGKYKKGVVLNTCTKKYMARITVDGKIYYIGQYLSEDMAHIEYLKMRMEWYGF